MKESMEVIQEVHRCT